MTCPEDSEFRFHPIGIIHSPYREKFAVPRQPGLVTAARGEIHLTGDCNRQEVLRGLEDFSHLWITFVFHEVLEQGWKPTVRPPRLGGNRKVGVFASRAPFRPNPLGLSVVEFQGIEKRGRQWVIKLGGIDMVNGTPVLDIKPYVPYADAIPDARGGFTENQPPAEVAVIFSMQSLQQLAVYENEYPNLKLLIEQVIAQQPQPAYHDHSRDRAYGMALHDLNIRWRVTPGGCLVEQIHPLG